MKGKKADEFVKLAKGVYSRGPWTIRETLSMATFKWEVTNKYVPGTYRASSLPKAKAYVIREQQQVALRQSMACTGLHRRIEEEYAILSEDERGKLKEMIDLASQAAFDHGLKVGQAQAAIVKKVS